MRPRWDGHDDATVATLFFQRSRFRQRLRVVEAQARAASHGQHLAIRRPGQNVRRVLYELRGGGKGEVEGGAGRYQHRG